MTDKPEKAATDWEGIEREYRAGQLSVSEIGRQFGVSHTAINKRAKKENWHRDLTEKVRSEINARLVSTDLVSEGVSTEGVRETIELAAQRGVQLVREHRADIGANRKAVTKLIDELHETIEHLDEIESDIVEDTKVTDADSKGEAAAKEKRRQRMLNAVNLSSRASTASTLATALKTLIPLERQAFGLQENNEPPSGTPSDPVNVTLNDASIERIKRLVE